jgi:hypothetical protein
VWAMVAMAPGAIVNLMIVNLVMAPGARRAGAEASVPRSTCWHASCTAASWCVRQTPRRDGFMSIMLTCCCVVTHARTHARLPA